MIFNLSTNGGGRAAGNYLWLRFRDGILADIVLANREDAYSEGESADGYSYQRIKYAAGQDETGPYLIEL